MENNTLKFAAVKGIIWSTIDKFVSQLGQFVTGIILARILMPEDFGLVGILSIFIALSQTFIESGLNTGLIQRQDRENIDFSTLFVFNLAVSTFFYLLLFFAAPFVASFFVQPKLINLTRILGLSLIINAFAVVQRAKLTIAMNFKLIAKSNAIGVFAGSLLAIIMVLKGCGVWSLVIQILVGSFFTTVSLWFLSNWRPSVAFSKKSFKSLFGYGSKLLIAGLYAQTLNNLYALFIGKFYPTALLGYYTRAKNYADLSAGTISSILQQVTFPILATVQDNEKKLVFVYSKMIRMSAFIIIPVMTMIALLAKPIVILLLTQKWEALIPLLQWIVFSRIFMPISTINMNLLNAVGRSDLFLKVDLSKLPFTIIAMVVTIPLGVKAMVIGHVATSALFFIINAYLPGKIYGYGSLKQIKDMLPMVVAVVIMAICVIIMLYFIDNLWLQLVLGMLIGFVTYIFSCWILQLQEINEIIKLFCNYSLGKRF